MQETTLQWLDHLKAAELVNLIDDLALNVDGVERWLELQRLSESVDTFGLRKQVDDVLAPTKSFYRYGQANAYVSEGWELVQLLTEISDEPFNELLPVIERAMTLVSRTVLRADSSSGAMGMLMDELMETHAKAARGLAGRLTPKERKRLAEWLVKFRYGGKQDFFDPDIVAYADALGADGLLRYRTTLSKYDLGPYGDYPLRRLAVLDRDVDAIVAAHGGEAEFAHRAEQIVNALAEADLHEDARRHAARGLQLPGADRAQGLTDYLVQDALTRGDPEAAVVLRRQQLSQHPSSTTFGGLCDTAKSAGVWDHERPAAEHVIRENLPWDYVDYLLHENRDEEAWQFAMANREAANGSGRWGDLCERRAKTDPADTLPIYRNMITNTLRTTDRRNYHAAARLLQSLKSASNAAEDQQGFDDFLRITIEENRRRPSCLEIFRSAGFPA